MRLQLLLLALSVRGTRAIDPAGNGPTLLLPVEDYFNYNLCDSNIGLAWYCYIPHSCSAPNEKLNELNKATHIGNIKGCGVLMAIQVYGNDMWRVVLQIHPATVDVQIKDGIKFFHETKYEFVCKVHGEDGISVLTQHVAASTLRIEEKTWYGSYKKDEMMQCEFIVKKKESNNRIFPHKVGIEWIDKATGTAKISSIDGQTLYSSDINFIVECELRYLQFRAAKNTDDYMAKKLVMDTREMKCEDRFQLRVKDEKIINDYTDDSAYKFYDAIKCTADGIKLVEGGVEAPGARSAQLHVQCIQKKCRACSEPTCSNADPKKCPKQTENKNDWKECLKLKCPADKYLFNGELVNDLPVCSETELKWKFGDKVVDKVECGETETTCPPSLETVKAKVAAEINFGADLVTCKNGEMSYASGNEKIMLKNVSCNAEDGLWYENLHPEGTKPYVNTSKLECSGGTGAAVDPHKGALLMHMGIALGALAFIAAIVFLIFCCCKRSKKKKAETDLKHKLATKSSKSKESKSRESKSKVASSSGATGLASSDHSVTQKNSKRDREKASLGIEKSEVATGISIGDQSNPKTATEIKDEERSNPTERSAIPKTDELKAASGVDAKKKKAAAMLESSKIQEEPEEEQQEEGAPPKIPAAGRKQGTRTRNLDGTQQTTMGPDGTQQGTTIGPDGTQNQTTMGPDGTQIQTKRRMTRKGTFMDTAVQDPTRGPDGTQQPSENGQVDEAGTQIPTNATADTQAATVAGARTRGVPTKGRRTQATQKAEGEEEDDQEQPLWTAAEKTEEGAATGIPKDRTRTRMHTAVGGAEDEEPPQADGEMRTGKEKRDDEEGDGLNTAMGKPDRRTVDKNTAKEKEDDETGKKIRSKKQRATLKPREIELNDKEKKIKAGAKRNRHDYPTMGDIESDWDSDKDKRDKPKAAKKKTLEEKKKKKEEKEKKESKKKDKEKKKKSDEKKDEKKKDRKKETPAGELREMTAVDDWPTSGNQTGREETAKDGTQNLTPYDPTQPVTGPTQRTRHKTKTVFTTAFDPTETHAAPTIADPTQAQTAQDFTQGATTMDRTQGGRTTLADRTQGGGRTRTMAADGTQGATTAADFTQAHTGADPTQAGTTGYDRTQAHTTAADATQGETRTRVLTGRTRTSKERGVSRTQTRTRADFTQGGTTAMDFTQGGATTVADMTQAHTQGGTTQGFDPTQAQTLPEGSHNGISVDEIAGTQAPSRDGTLNDPTQLHSAETQADGRTKRSRTKTALTGRTATRGPRTTQSRTKADFTQNPSIGPDGTQGVTTIADQTQGAHTAQDPTQAATTVGDGTQLGTKTKTRTRVPGTQTATAGDGTQTQTRTRGRDPTQTETRNDETQGQTDAPADGTQGTQIPSKTKTRKTTGRDFTQTATAGDGTQTQTAVDPTGRTMTAVDPTGVTFTAVDPTGRTMTAVDRTGTVTAVDRTRTETKEHRRTRTPGRTQTQTAVDPTSRTMTAVDPTGRTMTAVDRTGTMTAVDRTGTVTAVDRTGTQTAVDPTHTMTAVDPTRQDMTAVDPTGRTMTAVDRTGTMTAVDRTRTETKEQRRTRTQGRTQTQTALDRTGTMTAVDRTGTVTAVDPTHVTTAKDRTQTQTAVDHTGTATAVDPTHTMTAVDPTRQDMTAVDPTGRTMTAVDRTGTMTAVDRTRTGTRTAKGATGTQTATAAEQTQTHLERTKTAKDRTQTQTNADETQGHGGATTLGQAETQGMTKATTAKDKTQTATKGERTQTATRDKTREGRTQQPTSANKTQTTAKDQTQMTGHETTQGPTTKDPTQTHNDQ